MKRHPKPASGIDPIFSLIEADRAAHNAANERDLSQDEMGRRMDQFAACWWKLVETPPTTVEGAIAQAVYVAGLDDGEGRPTRREPDWIDENGSALALRSIANFLQSVSKGTSGV